MALFRSFYLPRQGEIASRTSRWLLGAILLLAFVLRFTGIFWGIPPFDAGYYHGDEIKIIQGAFAFPSDIAERIDLRYPTACHYTLGLITWPIRKLFFTNETDAFIFVYIAGRLISVILGTLTILLTYLIARRELSNAHALLASAILALSMLHVTNSAWATPDVATSFLLALFLLVASAAVRLNALHIAIAAGAILGLLVGSKYTGALAVIPLFVLVIAEARHRKGRDTFGLIAEALSNRVLWTVGLVSLAVFLLSTPGILLHPQEFLSSIDFERQRMGQSSMPLYRPEVWTATLDKMAGSMGLPIAFFAIVGLTMGLLSRRVFEVACVLLIVAFLAYFGSALQGRYLIMIMPVLAIFSAKALLFPIRSARRWLRVVAISMCGLAVGYCLIYSILAITARYPDTRTLAAKFIKEKLPTGSTVGIAYESEEYGWRSHAWKYPPIDFKMFEYVDFLENPDYIVSSSYDAQPILNAIRNGALGSEFVATDDFRKKWYRRSPPSPAIFRAFNDLYVLQHGYQVIARFAPNRWSSIIEFAAPTLEIFHRESGESQETN